MPKKLLDQVTDKIRLKGYSYKTEKSYSGWVKRFVLFHHKRHPSEMAKREIEQFLRHLAVERKVSPSTQNQAFNALIFLYEQVLNICLKNDGIAAVRAKQKIHIPVVLSIDEVIKLEHCIQDDTKGSAGFLICLFIRWIE